MRSRGCGQSFVRLGLDARDSAEKEGEGRAMDFWKVRNEIMGARDFIFFFPTFFRRTSLLSLKHTRYGH